MYGGRGRGLYVAYVGVAGRLKARIIQHLVRRDCAVMAWPEGGHYRHS